MDALDLNSVATDMMQYAEEQNLGKSGSDMFAHDWPDDEITKKQSIMMFLDHLDSSIHRVLSGAISGTAETFSVHARSGTEEKNRSMLRKAKEILDGATPTINKAKYLGVTAVTPIRPIGTDKNEQFMSVITFAVTRKLSADG